MFQIKNKSGTSLIEVLVAVSIIGFIALALTSLIVSQQKESRALADKLSALDLQQLLISTLADGSVCTFQLTDPSEASHRSAQTINIQNIATEIIELDRILLRGVAGSSVLIAKDGSVSALSPQMTVKSIVLENIQGSNDFFTANYRVDFASTSIRPPKAITVKTTLQTNPASPNSAKQIVGCKGVGASGRQWLSMLGQRAFNTDYINNTAQDIQVSVQVYSGASGQRCSASIRVDGVSVDYNFVNDSAGAAMCNATATVPVGSTYRASSGGAGSLYGWAELR
ncbi:type II secretion system protein [Bdellovibrio sp. HCB337]|uniref:type II secretion system protein n=1 Tax=Bdellovibrio sp. HCB337 TaxID=3394358 RepID=UPI0039A614BD